MAAVVIAVSVTVAYFSAPSAENARTAESYGLRFEPPVETSTRHSKPGEWLEYSPLLNILVGALLLGYLVNVFRTSPQGALAALDLNIYNLMFLTAGLLLHWRPRNFVRAVTESIPATGGVLIQFPFYAMIFGMIVGTGLSAKLAHLFTSASTHDTFALLAAGYSAVLGLFIPSGGSKWVVEAPYVLEAAIAHQVHLGWVVQIYATWSEALPNLINPFWMLPLAGILRLKARGSGGLLDVVFDGGAVAGGVFSVLVLRAGTIAFVPPMRIGCGTNEPHNSFAPMTMAPISAVIVWLIAVLAIVISLERTLGRPIPKLRGSPPIKHNHRSYFVVLVAMAESSFYVVLSAILARPVCYDGCGYSYASENPLKFVEASIIALWKFRGPVLDGLGISGRSDRTCATKLITTPLHVATAPI